MGRPRNHRPGLMTTEAIKICLEPEPKRGASFARIGAQGRFCEQQTIRIAETSRTGLRLRSRDCRKAKSGHRGWVRCRERERAGAGAERRSPTLAVLYPAPLS